MKKVLNLILIIVLILIIYTAYREHSQRSEPTAQENKAFPIPSTTEDENEDRDKSKSQTNSHSVTKKRNKPTSQQLADKCHAQHQELTISSQELEAQLQHHGINQLLFPIDYQPTAQEIMIKLQQAGIETTQVGKEWLFVTTIQTVHPTTVQTNTAYANDKAREAIEKL